MNDYKDKNGNQLKVGDFIKIFDLKVRIDYFSTISNNVMVGTDKYGELNISLVEKYID